MPKRKTHKQFLKDLYNKNEHYRNGEFEVVGTYEKASLKIKIGNEYGECEITPNNLLTKAFNITIQSAVNKTEYFINQAKEIHGDKYDYSKTIYIKGDSKIDIICKEHGSFKQNASSHLQGHGCFWCANSINTKNRTKTTKEFIKEAKHKHGLFYNYNFSEYVGSHNKIIIECPMHGKFRQTPRSHLNGDGCPKCKFENIGWSKSKWRESAKKSKYFDSFKLYKIRCWNENEEFYKIGRTFLKLNVRYMCENCTEMPYKYQIVKVIKSEDSDYIYDLENRFKKMYNKFKYKPLIKFGGFTECFKNR